MQIQSVIYCNKDLSLRKKIVKVEASLEVFGFSIKELQKQGRGGSSQGWTKLTHSREKGSVNFRWNNNLQALEVWTITKRTSPFPIYGDFIKLLSMFAKEVKSSSFCVS